MTLEPETDNHSYVQNAPKTQENLVRAVLIAPFIFSAAAAALPTKAVFEPLSLF